MSQPTFLPRRKKSTPVRSNTFPASFSEAAATREVFASMPVFDWGDRWRQQARCRQTDPDLFFPVGTRPMAQVQIEAAKAVCTGCAVRKACLDFALETNQEAGVWGGTSEEERRKLRRGRGRAGGPSRR